MNDAALPYVPVNQDPSYGGGQMGMYNYNPAGEDFNQMGMYNQPMGGDRMPSGSPMGQVPAVTVEVSGVGFRYHLTEEDLGKVFSRYGMVQSVNISDEGGAAVIHYLNLGDAAAAITDLNGKILNGTQGRLCVEWLIPASPPPAPVMMPQMPAPGMYPPPQATNVRKYTCRFDIGIENEEKFQVSRRIIGSKGANMKRVVRNSGAKLRLRGKGSGFLEGHNQQESSEPLHLCISCREFDGYCHAVRLMEELLTGIYAEYTKFCQDTGKPAPQCCIQIREIPLLFDEPQEAVNNQWYGPGATEGMEFGKGMGLGKGPAPVGFDGQPLDEVMIQSLIDTRNAARRACNFEEADRIRDELRNHGIALLDEPGARGKGMEVTTWRYWQN